MAQTATRGASPLYRDIAERTQGELYIGVVGPVRAGKSTFISNFMQQLVLPLVPPGPRRERIVDELPQSGSGKTIMTTQPKFVPSDGAATVQLPTMPPPGCAWWIRWGIWCAGRWARRRAATRAWCLPPGRSRICPLRRLRSWARAR